MSDNNRKVVVISGGGRGIGKSLALAFAEQAYHVCIFSRSEEDCRKTAEEISSLGADAHYWTADVKNQREVANVYQQIFERYGRIDTAVNNAGVIAREPLLNQGSEDIEKMVDINVKGTIHCCKAAAVFMKKKKSGSIINMASVGALIGLKGRSVYSATKGAIVALTKSLAIELASYNITVNALSPGAVKTPFNQKWFSENPHILQEIEGRIPLGRLADPLDIVDPVLFLASPAARYITGHTLVVDGGWTIS